jgi:hypothetical protein
MARHNSNHPKRGRFVALMTRVLRDAGVRGAIRPVGDGLKVKIGGDGPPTPPGVSDAWSALQTSGRALPPCGRRPSARGRIRRV